MHFESFFYNIGLSESEFQSSIKALIRDTSKRRKMTPSKADVRRTMRNFMKKNDIVAVNSQSKTSARFEAEYDIKNAISTICMWA